MLLHGRHAPGTGDRGELAAPEQGGDDRRLRRVLVAITLSGMAANVAFCVTLYASTLYVQQVRDLSPILAGVVFLAPSVCLAVARPLAGYLGARIRPATFMAGAVGAGALGLLVLGLVVAVAGLCVAAGATIIEVLQGPGTSEGDAVEELMRAVAIGALAVAVILALIRNRADAPASTVQSSPAT